MILAVMIWIPQIRKNYVNRQKNCPNMYYVWIVSISHLFFPMYVRGCPDTLFDRKQSIPYCLFLVFVMGIQLLILRGQQNVHPRFFIPKRYRRKLNEYNYYHEFPELNMQDSERNSIQEDEECIICMTSLRIE